MCVAMALRDSCKTRSLACKFIGGKYQPVVRKLAASSSIFCCRTANPTSFLHSVVGSASFLSATAIFSAVS